MGFKEQYIALKTERYLTDVEIAKKYDISVSTLKRWKNVYNVPDIRKPRKNEQGITEKELLLAESRGINRHLVLQRLRAYGWLNENAISEPSKQKKDKRRRTLY